MRYTYCQKPSEKMQWRFPQRLPGRQILLAIWRWM